MWEKWVSFGVNATIPILWGSEPGGGGRQADLGSARGTIASGSSAVNCAAEATHVAKVSGADQRQSSSWPRFPREPGNREVSCPSASISQYLQPRVGLGRPGFHRCLPISPSGQCRSAILYVGPLSCPLTNAHVQGTQVCTEGPRRATVRVGQESQGDVESAGTSCWQAGKKGQQLKLHYTVGGRIPAKKE
eukprot:GGOE01029415.1.p1 GENE.GGOE01029415.1~~GGOE01029415.1.p1  ORF type:complete len:191 (+),score=5.13 GGOE01029415.1:342-914(+)